MKEFDIKLVGNDEEIKNEEIFNDFDINYVPINNLPISYFPLNNGLLSYELKKVNNEDLTGGEDLTEINNNKITINSVNSPYIILVKKNIDCELNLTGIPKKIRLNKGIYTIEFNNNGYNIIQKNNKDILHKELISNIKEITIDFNNAISNVKKIPNLKQKKFVPLDNIITTPFDNYDIYSFITNNTLKVYKDITCDILLVGGGGGGGWYGGGGGGGGVVEKKDYLLKSGTYTIEIGLGGQGWGRQIAGNTIIKEGTSFILAAGGGGNGQSHGKNENTNGILVQYGNNESNSGGGGGSANKNTTGNGKSSGNGISGNGGTSPNFNEYKYSSGGGGGAVDNGGNGTINKSGDGGKGKLSKITGEDKYYGGGGGGAYHGKTEGISGDGGGGNFNTNGKENTGGGGGGYTNYEKGIGGSGIVIIRIKKNDLNDDIDISNYLISSTDTRIINEINEFLNKKMIEFNNNEKPYNYLGIYPLVILIIIFWIFIFLFLLKFVHHYFTSIYIYILLFIIIFLLIVGSFWFLYTNNDIL